MRTSDAVAKMNADDHTDLLEFTRAYDYTPRDRVAKVTKTAPGGSVLETESYVYDANANITSQTVGGTTTSYDYDRNRLLSAQVGGVTAAYNYDPFGRLNTVTAAGRIVEGYDYDGFGRVTEHRQITDTGATETTRYAYDPLDRTTSETTAAGTTDAETTEFDYLGLSDKVLAEEIAGKVQRSYTYSPWGQRLSQITHTDTSSGGPETSWYGYTPHTDVGTLTGQDGTTRATYGYTAYGKPDTEAFTGVDKPDPQQPGQQPYNRYRFNAKRFNPTPDSSDSAGEGGYDMGFRRYDPRLNRFLERDTYAGALANLNLVSSPWTGNRYAFAAGNPVSRVELDGHKFCSVDGVCSDPYDLNDKISRDTRSGEGGGEDKPQPEGPGRGGGGGPGSGCSGLGFQASAMCRTSQQPQQTDLSGVSGHLALDGCGLTPLVGAGCDAVNAGWYALEGKWGLAGLSAIAIIPGIGQVATGGKLATKGAKYASKHADDAASAVSGARLGAHLRQLEQYGKGGYKELQSGRFRYYGNLTAAKKPGEMSGRRLVREWDPYSGYTRTWHETLDHQSNVRIVRPETGGSKVHYYFDEFGNFGGKW